MQKFFMIFSNITFSLQWGKHRSLVHFLSGRDSGLLCANDRSSICCSRRYPMLLHQQFPLYTKPIQGTFSEGTKEANKVHDTKSHNSPRTIEFLGSTVLKFWNSGISIQRDGHQGGDCDACLQSDQHRGQSGLLFFLLKLKTQILSIQIQIELYPESQPK